MGSWLSRLIEFFGSLPAILSIKIHQRISPSLQEKILLSTASVNKCVLCARFASEMAFREGVDREEVLDILNSDLDDKTRCAPDELIALLYGRDYAQTDGAPRADIVDRLNVHYGPVKARAIEIVTKKSHFFNLSGNTFSACISRLRGCPAPGSNALFELFFALLHSWIIVPSWIYIGLKRNTFLFK